MSRTHSLDFGPSETIGVHLNLSVLAARSARLCSSRPLLRMQARDLATIWPSTWTDVWMSTTYRSDVVSVIVPVYNRASLLPDALDSVLAQTYRPIEVVVVDDGSTDDTAAVARAWAEDHAAPNFEPRVYTQENRGGAAARNHGLVQSTGEYIQYLDSDDLLHPDKIKLHAQVLDAFPDCSYVFSDLGEMEDREDVDFLSLDIAKALRVHATPTEFQPANADLPGNPTRGFYRRASCVATGPWDESLSIWDDVEYMNRYGMTHPRYVYIPGDLYIMRIHDQGRLQDYETSDQGLQRCYRAVRAMDRAIEEKGWTGNASPRMLSNFYLLIARRALDTGNTALFETALQQGALHRGDAAFNRRARILRSLERTLGSRICSFLLRAYNQIQ